MSDVQRAEWTERKQWGAGVFKDTSAKHTRILEGEESGDGWVRVFNVRPITTEVREYAVGDVTVLPALYRRFVAKLPAFKDGQLWVARVAEKTKEHINKSQSLEHDVTKGPFGVPGWEGLSY